ncbi:MAG: AI-2E family transporter [Alphaproteobacteria bacterium]|nr:AI-2E family transporter [Alphaproteobacteria bacterium]MBU0858932.1 AI-2E family transporter [Alphaproteobacteria bacterium]
MHTTFATPASIPKIYLSTQIMMILALLVALPLGLLPALLGGLLVYQLVEFGARMLERVGVNPLMGKVILVALLAVTVFAVFALCIALFASHISEGPESVVVLLQRMADVVDKGRSYLPEWVHIYLPANIDEWQVRASEWLRTNATELSVIGRDVGSLIVHLVFGMIIGGMIALNPAFQFVQGPFAQALRTRIKLLDSAFRRIVFSQIRISALNTALTGIFLLIIMPLMGMALPLVKTMIAVTFVVGLLPIVGNLISNTAIFLIALSVSPMAAICAITFLVVIHKLEYFINARIIGSQIHARAWEILLAMLVMEAAFGLVGLVAASIYYAYLKDELAAQKLI